MYCYTYVNEINCIFNELQLWSHVSSDHPVFLKNVAALSSITLPSEIVRYLDELHHLFQGLYRKTNHLKRNISLSIRLNQSDLDLLVDTIEEFMLHDAHAISFYPKLIEYGKDNYVWKELVNHIIDEQTFMLDLFEDLKIQLQ